MTTPTPTETPVPLSKLGALTIESIEVTPIIVPLVQEYRGSYYRMNNRAPVITRVLTREGIVGEAYAGDEDSTLLDITAVIADEGTAVASDPAWSSMCLGPPEVWGLNSMDHESITIRLVVRTTTSQKDTVARAMRGRITARLQREGIVTTGADG